MITKKSREELIAIGGRHHSTYVRAQGNYSVHQVRIDGPVLALIGEPFLTEVDAALAKLKAASTDRELMAAESADLTLDQGEALQEAKIWRRTITNRAKAAVVMGLWIPVGLDKVGRAGKGIGEIVADVERLADLADPPLKEGETPDPRLAELAEAHITPELIKKGRDLAAALDDVDTEQDIARLRKLPDSVKDLYVQKALVYLAVKQINLLAASVHTKDADARKKYNMDHLYRNTRRRPVDPPPEEPPKDDPETPAGDDKKKKK